MWSPHTPIMWTQSDKLQKDKNTGDLARAHVTGYVGLHETDLVMGLERNGA